MAHECTLRVEYAKSGRSACGTCRGAIPQGSVRVGVPYSWKGREALRWYHCRCAPADAVREGALVGTEHVRPEDLCALIELRASASPAKEVGVLEHNDEDDDNDDRERVYVLRLAKEGRFYVGKSKHPRARIRDHVAGGERCAAWVEACGGVVGEVTPLTPEVSDVGNWEMNETLARMMKHGFDNVRGFEWTGRGRLSRDELVTVRSMCCGTGDLCRRCGLPGHMASRCTTAEADRAAWMRELESLSEEPRKGGPRSGATVAGTLQALAGGGREVKRPREPTWYCEYCGKEFKTELGAERHEDAHCPRRPPRGGEKPTTLGEGQCYRCGRVGHWASRCYAKTDVNGRWIAD